MSQLKLSEVDFQDRNNYLSATIFFGARPMVRLWTLNSEFGARPMERLWTLNSEIEVRILSTEPFSMPVTPLPNGQARDCKSRYPGSNPGGVSIFPSSSVVRATSLISRMSPVRIQPGEPGFVCCQRVMGSESSARVYLLWHLTLTPLSRLCCHQRIASIIRRQ